jgi:hypothetical protein
MNKREAELINLRSAVDDVSYELDSIRVDYARMSTSEMASATSFLLVLNNQLEHCREERGS